MEKKEEKQQIPTIIDTSLKKHIRRTRQETLQNRDYKCGCGKTYLSYPALYLHLKNKHAGQIQEGTILPNQQQKTQKGRPKKSENQLFKQSRYDDKAIQNLQLYIQKMDSHYIQDFQVHIQDLKQNLDEIQKSLQFIPKEYQDQYNNFDQEFKQILNQDVYVEEKKDQNDLYSTKIINVFALFLYRTLIYINWPIFREIAFFLIVFINFLNKPHIMQDKNEIFCNINDCKSVLEYSNDFILNYLPQNLENKQFEILGTEDKHKKNHIILMMYLTDWLYDNNYTDSLLKIY